MVSPNLQKVFCLSLNVLQVPQEDIDMMFDFADKDGDGKISWKEFQIMINPPKPPEPPKPSLLDLANR